jgi:hypothetical protein
MMCWWWKGLEILESKKKGRKKTRMPMLLDWGGFSKLGSRII